jgi:hypothetical protein
MKRRTKKKSSPDQCIGALFLNRNRTHPRSPDLCGLIELPDDFIEKVVDAYEAGSGPVTLDLSAWRNQAQTSGMQYLTLKMKISAVQNQKRHCSEDHEIESLLQFIAEDDSE